MRQLNTRIVSGRDAFDQVRHDWARLHREDGKAGLFNSPEWAECWVEAFWEEGYRFHILLLEAEGRAVALVPLYYNPSRGAYYSLGTGEPEQGEVATEYVDILVSREARDPEAIYRSIAAGLESLPRGRAVFVNTVPGSHLCRLAGYCKRAIRLSTGRQYALHLSKDFDEVVDGFSRNMKRKARLLLNRYAKSPGLRFGVSRGEGFDRDWDAMRRLHQADWQGRGKEGAFAGTAFSRFHRCMRSRHPHIPCLFSSLFHQGELIAIHFYYAWRGRLYYYQSGKAANGHQRLSPGILLHLLTMRELGNEFFCYDFMKGSLEDSYKSRFRGPGEGFYTLEVFGRGPIAGLGFVMKKLKAQFRGT